MIDPDDREAGFYWISLDGQEAEVAQWQVEWNTWLLVGRARALTDEQSAHLIVLSDCLVPPHATAGSDIHDTRSDAAEPADAANPAKA